jgi:hypothetical protein
MTARYGNLLGITGGGGGSSTSLIAVNDTDSGAEDTIIEGNVLTNDSTEEGSLSVLEYRVTLPGEDFPTVYQPGQPATIGALGVFILAANGNYSFTPSANYSGSVPVITYTVTNGSEYRLATLTLTVTPANDAPVAGDAAALSFNGEAVIIDVADFVSDPDPGATVTLTHIDGTPVVLNAVVPITGGTYEWIGGTDIEVAPESGDLATLELTYTITDGTVSDTGNILVQVGVQNIPLFSPVAPLIGNALDTAAFNFGKTYRRKYGPTDENGTNVSVPPYSAGQGYIPVDPVYGAPTDREPWLYDRATTLWLLAKRTNNSTILAEAMQLARGYMAGVQLAGNGNATFNIIGTTGGDPTDVKYLYGAVAWWYERETLAAGGSVEQAQIYRTRAQGLYQQTLISFTQTYNPGSAELWTERNSWAAIMNCLAWYWISGSETALADATNYVEDILTLSDSSNAPLHSKDKHESDGDPTLIVSPWMSSLLCEAMLQYHRTTDSDGLSKSVPEWLSDYGDWLIDNAFYVATGAEEPELAGLAGLRIPAYLAGTGVQFPEGEAADMQHCTDVAEMMRKVKWAKEELSLSTVEVDEIISELEEAAEVDIAYWTRTTVGYPRYRVNPSRKYGWQFRCRYSYAHSVGIVPFPPSLTTAPVVTGSNQQGSTLSCSTGVWAGTPAPTFEYQWRRDGVDIVGATANTYATVEDDIGTAVDCMVTATNSGGSEEADSNNITVVPEGAPEITVQPEPAQALVGEQAVFSITATGTPAPTYQWQVSTNGGGAWNNVAEGTGGTSDEYTTEVLAEDDDGDMYRCVVTNAGGSVTSDEVVLTLVVQQEAVSFADTTDFAVLTHTLGSAGFVGWTVAGFFRRNNVINSGSWLSVIGAAGRRASVQYTNSGAPAVGDSQTGTAGGLFTVDPPEDAWFFIVFRGLTSHPGNYDARVYDTDGTLIGTASRASGVEDSLTVNTIHLNAAGGEPGLNLLAQYVRGYNRRLSDVEADAEYANIDMNTADLEFFNVFEDDGGGGVSVRDATGNNREFVLTGAILSVDGPVAPTV